MNQLLVEVLRPFRETGLTDADLTQAWEQTKLNADQAALHGHRANFTLESHNRDLSQAAAVARAEEPLPEQFQVPEDVKPHAV